MAQKIRLNTFLDTMIMILLAHYAYGFQKWLSMLENMNLI